MKYIKLTVFAVLVSCGLSLPVFSGTAAAPEEAFTGKIFTTDGVVEHQKAGSDEWFIVKAPFAIEAGDKVRTGPGAMAEIYIKYGAKVRLAFAAHQLRKESPCREARPHREPGHCHFRSNRKSRHRPDAQIQVLAWKRAQPRDAPPDRDRAGGAAAACACR